MYFRLRWIFASPLGEKRDIQHSPFQKKRSPVHHKYTPTTYLAIYGKYLLFYGLGFRYCVLRYCVGVCICAWRVWSTLASASFAERCAISPPVSCSVIRELPLKTWIQFTLNGSDVWTRSRYLFNARISIVKIEKETCFSLCFWNFDLLFHLIFEIINFFRDI